MKINNHFYATKKFNGFGFFIDCDSPQTFMHYKTLCIIQIKLFFIGCWFVIEKKL